MKLRSLSNEWRDEIRAERGMGISRSRRDPDVVTWALIALSAALMATAIYQAWPTSQESQQARPNLHAPAPVAGDSFRRLERRVKDAERKLAELEGEQRRMRMQTDPHAGLPAVLPDAKSLEWGNR